MNYRRVLLAVISFVLATQMVAASRKTLLAGETCHGSHCVHCPNCNTCCRLEVKDANEEKHCWNVECQEICVPRVVFPWQKSRCDPSINNGAWVKTVRVLKKHSFECPTCQYAWTLASRACSCTARDSSTVDGAASADSVVMDATVWPAVEPQQPPIPLTAQSGEGGFSIAPSATTSRQPISKKSTSLVSFKSLRKIFASAKKRLPDVRRGSQGGLGH